MINTDPIIAVKNVVSSSEWYQQLLGCRSMHGGSEFDILVDENENVLLCLHQWGTHAHPTMQNPKVTPGNGLILYFRTDNMTTIRANAEQLSATIEKDIHVNENSTKKEFSLRDPDGYYLTITEYHVYKG